MSKKNAKVAKKAKKQKNGPMEKTHKDMHKNDKVKIMRGYRM